MISRLPSLLVRSGALFSLLFFASYVGWQWFGGTATEWASAGDKSGDLIQHYAAGQVWRDGDLSRLYRGFYLGDWINQWSKTNDFTHAAKIENFNYVYGPLVASFASAFSQVSWENWIRGWVIWIVLCYITAFALLWRTEPSLRRLGLPSALLFFGFPSFYYCFIPLQNGTMTLLILVCTGFLLLRKLPLAAGFVLSCAFYKPQLMPYLAFFALAIGQWRLFFGICLGTAAWLGLSLLFCGWNANHLWIESLRDMSSGLQFQRNTMNISLRGFFLTALPGTARPIIDMVSPIIALVVLGGAGWKIRQLSRTLSWWQPQHSLYAGLIAWTLAIPYCGHYEILLGLPWWLIYLSQPGITAPRAALAVFYWVISLTSISGTDLPVSITSLFTLIWLIASLATIKPSSRNLSEKGLTKA